MIKNTTPLSMAEIKDYVKEDDKDLVGFIKKFSKLTQADAKDLRKKLQELDLIKLKTEYIVKIIDFLPENSLDLNKIFEDISLDEDETKKILDTIKQFK